MEEKHIFSIESQKLLSTMVKLYAPVPQRLDGIWDIPYPIFTLPQRLHGCMKKNGIYRYIPKKYCHIKKQVFFGIWEMNWNIPILICHIITETHGRWYGISHFKVATSCATNILGYSAKIGIFGILIISQKLNLNKGW